MPLRKAWSVFTSIHFQNKLSAFSFGILFVLVDHVVRTLQYYKLCPFDVLKKPDWQNKAYSNTTCLTEYNESKYEIPHGGSGVKHNSQT